MNPTQIHRPAGILTTLPPDTLVLRGFSGEEQLSRPFRFLADLSSTDPSIDFDRMVGGPACIQLEIPGREDPRYFHGIVSRFVQIPGDVGEVRYQAEIVPWLWLLTRTADCRIYQEQSVVEIVEDVFRRFGFTDFRLRLSRPYRKREYCVQYRETSFDFVNRLLESEGITYFFIHSRDKHLMILADSPAGHAFEPGYEVVGWHPAEASSAVTQSIRRWVFEKQLQPSTYVHTEYDFTKPRADLRAAASFPGSVPGHEWEVFDYPGEYQDLDDGETYANLRAEELGAAQDVFLGESDARGLAAGFTFQLENHPRRDQNEIYLITGLRLRFDQSAYITGGRDSEPSYQCDFSCLPAKRPFRPRRITRKPIIHGEQTAVVVGAAGKEIEVDDYARVKVHFFWDRHNRYDESASCWLRVSQPWAGKGYGGMNVPRIGVEVIVGFLEGDPDRPIITGRVYNKATMPHASNAGRDGKPGNSKPTGIQQAAVMTSFKSESTPGGGGSNEITMNDTAGAEGLFLKAQKDEVHKVGNDREDEVGNDEKRKVANNREREVGVNEKVKVGANQDLTVGVNQTASVGANQDLTVGVNQTASVGVNQSLTVGVCRTQTVGVAENILTGVIQTIVTGLVQLEAVGIMRAEAIGLIRYSLVGLNDSLTVGNNRSVTVGNNLAVSAGNDFIVEAATNAGLKAGAKMVIECPDITLKGAGGFIRIDAGGVTIWGTKIKLNCAGAEAGSLAPPEAAAGGPASSGSSGSSPGSAAPSAPPAAGAATPPSPVTNVLTELGVPPNTAAVLGDLAGGTLPSKESILAAMPSLREVVDKIPKDRIPEPLRSVIGPLASIATGSPEEIKKELEVLRKKAVEEAKKRLEQALKDRLGGGKKPKKEGTPHPPNPPGTQTPPRPVDPPISSGNTTIIKNPAPTGGDTVRLRRRPGTSSTEPPPPPDSTDTARFRRSPSEPTRPDPKPPTDTGGSGSSPTQRFRRPKPGGEGTGEAPKP